MWGKLPKLSMASRSASANHTIQYIHIMQHFLIPFLELPPQSRWSKMWMFSEVSVLVTIIHVSHTSQKHPWDVIHLYLSLLYTQVSQLILGVVFQAIPVLQTHNNLSCINITCYAFCRWWINSNGSRYPQIQNSVVFLWSTLMINLPSKQLSMYSREIIIGTFLVLIKWYLSLAS